MAEKTILPLRLCSDYITAQMASSIFFFNKNWIYDSYVPWTIHSLFTHAYSMVCPTRIHPPILHLPIVAIRRVLGVLLHITTWTDEL